MIVTDTRQLQDVCSKLRQAGSFGFDTEFVRERTYYIRLGILQVATAEVEAILDPHAIDSLEPFFELITDPSIEKVVHAGEQDFAVLFERSGKPPANVFDTQIASALVGYGEQLSYAKIVEKVAGVKTPKVGDPDRLDFTSANQGSSRIRSGRCALSASPARTFGATFTRAGEGDLDEGGVPLPGRGEYLHPSRAG